MGQASPVEGPWRHFGYKGLDEPQEWRPPMGIGSVSIPWSGHSGKESGLTGYGKGRVADAGDIRSALRITHPDVSGRENPIGERGIPVHPPGAVW